MAVTHVVNPIEMHTIRTADGEYVVVELREEHGLIGGEAEGESRYSVQVRSDRVKSHVLETFATLDAAKACFASLLANWIAPAHS